MVTRPAHPTSFFLRPPCQSLCQLPSLNMNKAGRWLTISEAAVDKDPGGGLC